MEHSRIELFGIACTGVFRRPISSIPASRCPLALVHLKESRLVFCPEKNKIKNHGNRGKSREGIDQDASCQINFATAEHVIRPKNSP